MLRILASETSVTHRGDRLQRATAGVHVDESSRAMEVERTSTANVRSGRLVRVEATDGSRTAYRSPHHHLGLAGAMTLWASCGHRSQDGRVQHI